MLCFCTMQGMNATMRILRGRWKSAVVVSTLLFTVLYGVYRLYYNFENHYADRESPYMKVGFIWLFLFDMLQI